MDTSVDLSRLHVLVKGAHGARQTVNVIEDVVVQGPIQITGDVRLSKYFSTQWSGKREYRDPLNSQGGLLSCGASQVPLSGLHLPVIEQIVFLVLSASASMTTD